MTAPTPQQLETLRLMAAGIELLAPEKPGGRLRLVLDQHPVRLLQQRTVDAMRGGGWVIYDPAKNRWILTKAGRDRAECGAFVRFYAETVR